MAKQALLPNKLVSIAGLILCLFDCQQSTPKTVAIPGVFVSVDQSGWQKTEGNLWLTDTLFSGWQYQLWPTGDTAFVCGFNQGKAEGLHRQWYPNHRPKESRHYRKGWQEGEQRGWFPSGRQAFIYHFQNDVYEGNVNEWYSNGRPARTSDYHEGHENGLQRLWYADGSLKANYVARNGRNYGFTGVKNCVNVWDSLIVSH
ncbi:toxin-antitoxin system YwqK family antitoxin [Spirosoma flavum]|uniref:Toxin-antitoxin system YwqK family antitoxin n=1 Tax=Spirosoma flavum TaxID=2048557 RepID=A0ABW6AD22_9BACT